MPNEEWNMTSVASSQIDQIGFNPATNQGRALFLKNQALYEYDGCTQSEADEIINAPSVGQAFGAIWKGVKGYRRIS